jgi:hypothetical protein
MGVVKMAVRIQARGCSKEEIQQLISNNQTAIDNLRNTYQTATDGGYKCSITARIKNHTEAIRQLTVILGEIV